MSRTCRRIPARRGREPVVAARRRLQTAPHPARVAARGDVVEGLGRGPGHLVQSGVQKTHRRQTYHNRLGYG